MHCYFVIWIWCIIIFCFHCCRLENDPIHYYQDSKLFLIQALNTLGNTKWRVNKRILSIVDRIWANGGRLADLVDREDVSNICMEGIILCISLFQILMFILTLSLTDDNFIFLLLKFFNFPSILFSFRSCCQRNPIRKMNQKLRNGGGKSKL